MKLPPDFRDLLEEFAREGVEHVVIGGGRPQDQVDVAKLERVRAAQRR